MNQKILLVILFGIIIIGSMIPAESLIPPTRAFEKFIIGSQYIEANTWNGKLNITCSGLTCSIINGTTAPQLSLSLGGNNNISIKNQAGSIKQTKILTVSSSGLYRISVYQNVVSNDISGSLSSTIAWTDEAGNTRGISPASNISFVTVTNYSQGTAVIDVQSGTDITYQTTVSGTAGTPTYNIFITVEKL